MRRWIIIVALLLPSSACSTLKIGYGLADWYIENWAHRFLDLDDTGTELVDREIDAYMQWHRVTMLPRYASFLHRQAALHAKTGFTREACANTVAGARDLWEQTVRGALPHAAAVLVTQTSPAKLAHLRAKMAERDTELRERMSRSKGEVIEERADSVIGFVERFTGDLNDAQKAMIRRHAEQMYVPPSYWMRNRTLRMEAFTTFMSKRPTESELVPFLESAILRPHELSEPGYEKYSNTLVSLIEGSLFELFSSFSPKQRATLAQSLRDYAGDLNDLSS